MIAGRAIHLSALPPDKGAASKLVIRFLGRVIVQRDAAKSHEKVFFPRKVHLNATIYVGSRGQQQKPLKRLDFATNLMMPGKNGRNWALWISKYGNNNKKLPQLGFVCMLRLSNDLKWHF